MATRHTNEPGTEPVHETTAEPGAAAPVQEEGEYRTVREEETTRMRPGGMAARVSLTLLGAAGMIYGAFLDWLLESTNASRGIDANWTIFFSTNPGDAPNIWSSAGFVIIVLGILAVIGLAFRTGWLTSLAGALAVAAMVLLGITFYRVTDLDLGIQDFGVGAWLIVAGGLLALIGGFFGARQRVIVIDRERVVPA
jgi:hypothetical protein